MWAAFEEAPGALRLSALDPADELSLDFDPLDCNKMPAFLLAPFCMGITGMRECSRLLALEGFVSSGLLLGSCVASHAHLDWRISI